MPATRVNSSWVDGGLKFDGNKMPSDLPAVFFNATIGVAKNELGVAAYCETHINGALSGTTYGFGSWLNLDAGAVTGANILTPQDNGIYDAGSATLTNTKVIMGMRMEAILASTPGSIFLFSTNIYAQVLTALFDINAIGDVAWASGAASAGVGKVPLFKSASSGQLYYVNVYTS